ncbi:aldo/keto reductase [Pelagivirga sediminicola]|uniref:Aldo/keto reductase n=1 Tax=Pelagivirga sediminicola TaxID=2170575 RepID=A0A2T7G4E8_9RHOB|nr:aldo/keto reductase [Pelagivirga sediminicola]PVA09288.1 aldo/keto reductase [Pelagivirga sediminicola]
MKMNSLGRTGLMVSELCLGSMTWGTQNTEAEGHAQIDRALERGINFIDTAEMYPVAPKTAETQGRTEEVIGTWLAATGRRRDVIIASKINGPGMSYVRGGAPITAQTIPQAVEGSLKRLQTDHIDLYQLHWPNRGSYMFRQNWAYDPSGQDTAAVLDNIAETLETLAAEVARGTIGHVGLSNESAWGTAQFLRLAEANGWPRVASLQNEYSLLCRLYDTDLAELSAHEDVGLLAYSPLATGLLSGKYQGGAVPAGSRRSIVDDLGGRTTTRAFAAVQAYLDIAARHGLDPSQMALAWTLTRPFMASSIFGATTMEQLDLALGAADLTLSTEVLDEIDTAHRAHPMPF